MTDQVLLISLLVIGVGAIFLFGAFVIATLELHRRSPGFATQWVRASKWVWLPWATMVLFLISYAVAHL